jgi:hypothetical protein
LTAIRYVEGDDMTRWIQPKTEDKVAPIRDPGKLPDILELAE